MPNTTWTGGTDSTTTGTATSTRFTAEVSLCIRAETTAWRRPTSREVTEPSGTSTGSPSSSLLQYSPDYHLFYPRHIEWYTAGRDLERIDAIKAALMEYGVMGTCMCYSYQFIESLIHYQPPSSDELPNHAIAIIGWNDTLRTQAPEPGAWLCKNSWGEEWGMDGCFWISYHDRWAGHEPQMGAVSFREVEPMRYDKVLYHDLHGWRDTMAEATEAMNAFAVESPTLISSGGFFTASDSTAWRLSVYSGFDGYEPCELLASDSGMFVHTGYHTVDFPEPFEAMKGDSLFVVLLLDRGGSRMTEPPKCPSSSARNTGPSSSPPHPPARATTGTDREPGSICRTGPATPTPARGTSASSCWAGDRGFE